LQRVSRVIEMAELSSDFWRQSAAEPGGFCWWYLDLTDEAGNGLVLIWALGLPFLAGSRRGLPARSRPALNLALYRGGRCDLYLLQEFGEDQADFTDASGSAVLGRSRIDVSEKGEDVRVRVLLDEALPGTKERLVAQIDLRGPRLKLSGPSAAALHLWTPRVVGGPASARVTVGSSEWQFDGTGYFDGNASPVGLHAQGIASWRWGRVNLGERSVVFYDLVETDGSKTCFVLEARADGSCRAVEGAELRFGPEKSGLYGLSAPRSLDIMSSESHVRCQMQRLVDDGPFYQRFLMRAEEGGVVGHGVYEVVSPHRLDVPWQRPFVRMRTHSLSGERNSSWLPLFSGPRRGRTGRLLRSWLGSHP